MEKLLTTKEVAALTGLSRSWFEHQRWLQSQAGPKWVKLGRAVRYRRADVEQWLEAKRAG